MVYRNNVDDGRAMTGFITGVRLPVVRAHLDI